MGLSRKRQRELNRLKRTTNELWEEQKEVLDNASKVMREARRQLADLSREEVAPRVRDIYEHRVRPGVESGLDAGRHALGAARRKVSRDVLPALSSAVGSAVAAIDVAKDPRVRQALGRMRETSAKAIGVPAKPAPGPSRYILMGIGLVVVAGVAYAAWQTLRADDELWVSDEADGEDAVESAGTGAAAD